MQNRAPALLVFMGLLALPVLVAVARSAPSVVIAPTPSAEVTPEMTPEVTAEPTAEITPEVTSAADLDLVGDAAHGDLIFHNGLNGAPACSNCHRTDVAGTSGPFALAPGLLGISERAATRVEGETAPQYIEHSIRHPADYIVQGFRDSMYANFAQDYTDQAIADLVAYLMTL